MSEQVRTVLVLSSDEDHAIAWAVDRGEHYQGQHISLVWPFDRLHKVLTETDGFDALVITPDVMQDPRAKTWIGACQLKVRGKDGKTVGQRLVAGEA